MSGSIDRLRMRKLERDLEIMGAEEYGPVSPQQLAMQASRPLTPAESEAVRQWWESPEPTRAYASYTDADTVKRVQAALRLNVDGIIGPKTRAAVKKYNEQRGVAMDGERITDGTLSSLGIPKPSFSAPASMSSYPLVSAARPVSPKAPSDSEGFFTKNVSGLNIPVWQVMLGAVGIGAIGYGLYKVMSDRPAYRAYARGR